MENTEGKEKTAKKEKKNKTSIFKGVKTEFNKIVWPDRETVGKETAAVLVCSVALGLIIALLDLAIKYGLNFIL